MPESSTSERRRRLVRALVICVAAIAAAPATAAACTTSTNNGQIFIKGLNVVPADHAYGNQHDVTIHGGTLSCNVGEWAKVGTVHNGLGPNWLVEIGYLLRKDSSGGTYATLFTEKQTPSGTAANVIASIHPAIGSVWSMKAVPASATSYALYAEVAGSGWGAPWVTYTGLPRDWIQPRGETERFGTGTGRDTRTSMYWRNSAGAWSLDWNPAISVGSMPGYHFTRTSNSSYTISL